MRRSRSSAIATIAAIAVFGCGKKDENKNESEGKEVTVSASALALAAPKLNLLAGQMLAGPKAPDYANGEYDGMGVLTSDAVVDSLKIVLKSVNIMNGMNQSTEFPFEEKELEISGGVNEAVTVKGILSKGSYDRVSVSFKPMFKLKAYAYMDTNNDGTIDTTVYTTPTAVVKTASRLSTAQMTAAGYGEYKYGFAYIHCSDSVTDSKEGQCGTISVFETPFNTEEPQKDADGNEIASDYTVNILIDSTKIVKAWTGDTSGTYQVDGSTPTTTFLGNGTNIPMPTGFPLSDTCSDTKNQWGFNTCDFYKPGTPAFKLEYLPAFAFLGTANLTSQVYLVSTESGVWNHYNAAMIQLVLRSGKPVFGLSNSPLNLSFDQTVTPWRAKSHAAPIIGSVVRLFEQTAESTYTFYMDGGSKSAAGVDDGGLYYNNDKTMAGYIGEGFKILPLNGTGTLTVKDGPRCKSEYDYCVGTRTYYVKRLK